MSEPCGFDPMLLGELMARRWQEDRGYYSLNGHAEHRWLEALWSQRADHRGVELHWIRRTDPHLPAALTSSA